MGPFSHYILAEGLRESIRPENKKEYDWGAVAADIRYLANIKRSQTHLELNRLQELMSDYPHLRSFLLGYQVHVLVDDFSFDLILQIINTTFPLNVLKKFLLKSIALEQMIMLVEMYYLQYGSVGEYLGGDHNEVLSGLGITLEQTRIYQEALQNYFRIRTFDSALSAFQKIGMLQNSRIEKYRNAYRVMQKRKVIYNLILLSLKNARLNSKMMDHVRSKLVASDIFEL